MAVLAKKYVKYSFNLLLEKPPDSNTFYETNFELFENKISDRLYKNVKGNTLPGIAFLFYGGSIIFIYPHILISIIAALFEIFAFKLSSQNLIFIFNWSSNCF